MIRQNQYLQCLKLQWFIVLQMILCLIILIGTTSYAKEEKKSEKGSSIKSGEIFFSNGMYKEAIKEFEKALANKPNDVQINKKLGLSYFKAGELDPAIKHFSAVLDNEPNDTETIMVLADTYSQKKQFDKSIGLYKRALTLEPKNVWFLYKLAEALSWAKRYEESIQEYKRILYLEPQNFKIRMSLGEVYAWQAKEEDSDDLYNKAIMEFEKVIQNDYSNLLAHKKLGWTYLEKGDLKEAEKRLEIAHQFDPNDYETKMFLAQAYAWGGRFNKAIEIYKCILAEKPDDIGTLYKLGEVLSWIGDYDESIASYEKIIEKEPTNMGARLGIARIQALKWNYAKAGEDYDKILDKNPKEIGALLGLAEVDRRQWRWKDSRMKYIRVLQLDPTNKAARKGLREVELITSPSLQAISGYFEDSDNFERSWMGSHIKLKGIKKISLSLKFLHWKFHQKYSNLRRIHRDDYSLKIKQHLNNFFDLELGYTLNDYSAPNGSKDSVSASGILNLKEKAIMYLSYAHNAPIVGSILTVKKDFSAKVYGFGINYHIFKKFSFQGGLSISDYSDDNTRYSRDAQLTYKALDVPYMVFKIKYAFLDFTKQDNNYWTPTNYETYSFILDVKLVLFKKTILGIQGKETFFHNEDKWGNGVKGYINTTIKDSLNIILSGNYFDAETKDPWLGKSFELKVTYIF